MTDTLALPGSNRLLCLAAMLHPNAVKGQPFMPWDIITAALPVDQEILRHDLTQAYAALMGMSLETAQAKIADYARMVRLALEAAQAEVQNLCLRVRGDELRVHAGVKGLGSSLSLASAASMSHEWACGVLMRWHNATCHGLCQPPPLEQLY